MEVPSGEDCFTCLCVNKGDRSFGIGFISLLLRIACLKERRYDKSKIVTENVLCHYLSKPCRPVSGAESSRSSEGRNPQGIPTSGSFRGIDP